MKTSFQWDRFYKDNKNVILGTISVILFFFIWEFVSHKGYIDPMFISSPTAIAKEFGVIIGEPAFWTDLRVSGYEFVIGFFLAMVFGIPLGVITGWNSTLYSITNPFVSALYVTPRLALMPVIVIAFGIGPNSKIAMVILMSIFPIILNAQKSMQTVDTQMINAARSFGASNWQVFRTISLPSSIPFLLTGIRLGIGLGLIGVVVGELYAASAGIGAMLTTAGATLNTDRMFVGVIIFAASGMVLSTITGLIEKRFSSWRPQRD